MKSKHAGLLNDLDQMQQSVAYALRRSVLAQAEAVIVEYERVETLQTQRIRQLQRELAEAQKWRGVMTEIADRNQQRAAALEARSAITPADLDRLVAMRVTVETAVLSADAERYRWLKANHLQTGTDSWIRTGDDLEEAIDAALSAISESKS